MDQPPPVPIAPPAAPVPREPAISLLARLLNVFAIPGAVFEDVKNARHSVGSWLVPVILASLIGALGAVALYSQPAFLQEIHTSQSQYLDSKVKAGQMTKEQADQTQAIVDKFMKRPILMGVGITASVLGSFASVFGWGLVLWYLARRFLRIRIPYRKGVEISGLAMMISVLGNIVKLLLIYNVGKMFSTKSFGLTISDFDPDNPNYLLLITINVFQFWFIGLLAAGLARLANVPFQRAMFLLLTFWMLRAMFLILLGLGALVV